MSLAVLRITEQHRTKTVMWNTRYRNPIAERDLVAPLGEMIRKFVVETEAYAKLPKARGGYL